MAYTPIPASGRTLALLIRHGRTSDNKKGVLRAWADQPLDRSGELDAQMAANILRPYNVQMLYSSDLTRDMQTAHIISKALNNVPTEVAFELRTADMGELTEQPEDEVADIVKHWYMCPWMDAPSGESYDKFAARLFPFIDRKLQLAEDVPQMAPIALVSHGRTFAALDSRYNYKSPVEGKMALPGGVAVLKLMPDGRIRFGFIGPTENVIKDA